MSAVHDLLEQLRRTLGRLEAALSSVEDSLVLTDFQGTVEWTNRAFDKLVSRPRLRSLGQPLHELLPQRFVDGQPQSAGGLLAWARNGPGSTVWDLAPTPPRKVIEISWSPVNLNPAPSLVFVFRDLSAITQVQDELTASRTSLEEEVASRTRELREARDEALAATGEMGTFLSTISHEIRTPLNAVIGMTELLLDSDLNQQQKELVETIHSSGELLLRLINDILDLSKIEARKLSIRADHFAIRDLIQECTRIVDASIRSKGLKLFADIHPDVPDEMYGDSLRIRQIVLNLLSNAIKFTDEGFIRLDLSCQFLTINKLILILRISDTGHGISSDFLPRMFESFSQENLHPQLSNQSQGTGLGLAICDRLSRLMGGNIEVDSKLGQGTSFRVNLPLLYSGPVKSRNGTGHPEPLESIPGRHKILVAEDNRINQRVLELLLNKLNQEAEFVTDGKQAVDRVLKGGVEIVFMDLQMPELDGLEATKLLRRSTIEQPYIIALTAFAFGGHENECLEAGMNDFLNKPVRGSELKGALDRYDQWRSKRNLLNQLSASTAP